MKVVRFHCDGCGQFIASGKVVTIRDPVSGKLGDYHPSCARAIAPGKPIYAQKALTGF